MEVNQILGLVLAGGQGSRMGGVDKGLQLWHEQRLVDFSIQAIKPLCREIIISCNRNLDVYGSKSSTVITDIDTGYHGPLSGLVSVMKAIMSQAAVSGSDVQWLLVSPCDTPNVLEEDFRQLLNLADSDQKATLVALTDNDKQHPLHCLIHRSMFESIIQAYDDGQRSVFRVFKRLGVVWVPVNDADRMRNVNALP
jgi:molybdopterin-guanine dinucleotide biosynthesis protein A